MSDKKIIFLDWDDTLFFTHVHDYIETIPIEQELFAQYIDNLYAFLEYIVSKGRVIIVTNGSVGWVMNGCCEKYPQLKNIFVKLNIELISARDRYSQLYPKEYVKWKKLTFKSILDEYKNNNLHVISIGDSNDERIAVWHTTGIDVHCVKKVDDITYTVPKKNIKTSSLKLIKKPTFNILSNEIKLLRNFWVDLLLDSNIECDYIIDSNYNMIFVNGIINMEELWMKPVLCIVPRINITRSIHYNLRKRKINEINDEIIV